MNMTYSSIFINSSSSSSSSTTLGDELVSSTMTAVSTADTAVAAGQWTWSELQNATTESLGSVILNGVNRTNYTALIGEFYDDFEYVCETYLMTILALIGIVLNTVTIAATCRDKDMRRMARALHCILFLAENLFLAGFVDSTATRAACRVGTRAVYCFCFLPAMSVSSSCEDTSEDSTLIKNMILRYIFYVGSDASSSVRQLVR